jgi:hypothetical protein
MSHCYLNLWLPKPIFQHSLLLNLWPYATAAATVVAVEEVISEVKSWFRQRPAECYREGIQALASLRRKAMGLEGHYVEK